jgi:hypothetical protein
MKKYVTQIQATETKTGQLKLYEGQLVNGISFQDAQEWCDNNAPYLKVIGEYIGEVDEKGFFNDFEKTKLN